MTPIMTVVFPVTSKPASKMPLYRVFLIDIVYTGSRMGVARILFAGGAIGVGSRARLRALVGAAGA